MSQDDRQLLGGTEDLESKSDSAAASGSFTVKIFQTQRRVKSSQFKETSQNKQNLQNICSPVKLEHDKLFLILSLFLEIFLLQSQNLTGRTNSSSFNVKLLQTPFKLWSSLMIKSCKKNSSSSSEEAFVSMMLINKVLSIGGEKSRPKKKHSVI